MTLLQKFNPRNWGDDGKDSSYEDEVKERCDHEYGDWHDIEEAEVHPVLQADGWYEPPRLERGHLVFEIIVEKERFCTLCGERDARLIRDGRAAIPLAFRLGDDLTMADAVCEPVTESADYAVGEDGTTTVIEDGPDEPGRVIVNRNVDEDIFVDDEPADDQPVKAGGATD